MVGSLETLPKPSVSSWAPQTAHHSATDLFGMCPGWYENQPTLPAPAFHVSPIILTNSSSVSPGGSLRILDLTPSCAAAERVRDCLGASVLAGGGAIGSTPALRVDVDAIEAVRANLEARWHLVGTCSQLEDRPGEMSQESRGLLAVGQASRLEIP